MAELWDTQGAGCSVAAAACPQLAGNRLNLDVYPDGCRQFLQLLALRPEEVRQVQFLRLSCNEKLIDCALASAVQLTGLTSLVLKGGHSHDKDGAIQHGLLTGLPENIGRLVCLVHLDLSFNSFSFLPECLSELANLTVLLLCYNHLQGLPEDLGKLRKLTVLSAMCNQITNLPSSIGDLRALQVLNLSENSLQYVPEEIGNLQSCTELDLSNNQLEAIPNSLANLRSLQKLRLNSNRLASVPAALATLPFLSRLDLQNNSLRAVPIEIQQCPCVHLRGNPLGRPASPEPEQISDSSSSSELRVLFLTSDEGSFTVPCDGCRVCLPCGVHLSFPFGAVSSETRVHYQKLPPDPQWVKLHHHDVLLSQVLELQPHGIQFFEEVKVWIPYVAPRSLRKREVVIRTRSGLNWSDLDTKLEPKGKHKYLAKCSVSHFSWFLVISRLVEDQCIVPQNGALLFSTVEPSIRVRFPAGATDEMRTVKMQVLPITQKELQEITDDPESTASPLLCLSQSSAINFLKPVKIQLPLPPGVTGHSLERSRLHLLHGDLQAQTWNDITNQVVLEFTHIYALFEVDHFSWYWLWYTTKTYVGGIAKKVYERLRLYQVNFVALQRKRHPEQVLLQCAPKHKVETVVKKLRDRYRGPEPSELVDMFEGEQFFAGFEKGLELDADRPDCVDGRISFVFYSHMKNMKEIYVKPAVDGREQDVNGQVSFYRGAIPDTIPEDCTKKRKGPDSQWLATLPIKLPKVKSHFAEHHPSKNGFSLPPLNLGNAETGYLTETNLLGIASRIGADWRTIGMNLGLSFQQLERICHNNREDLDTQILEMLFVWAKQNTATQDCVKKLIEAMGQSGRQDIADEIESIIELGKKKYSESIRRVGLDQESSNEDSAIAMV
ncbi:p53-induced death domain-containing protein 1 [Ambystoma mexicanum]|uniref:p53-induced death domain-containing protein 1 n=1 Tax=Ambystoma mexicanum TaxID=8296 RepID=UPI0037E97D6D